MAIWSLAPEHLSPISLPAMLSLFKQLKQAFLIVKPVHRLIYSKSEHVTWPVHKKYVKRKAWQFSPARLFQRLRNLDSFLKMCPYNIYYKCSSSFRSCLLNGLRFSMVLKSTTRGYKCCMIFVSAT